MWAKTSNHSFLLLAVYILKLLTYLYLQPKLANVSPSAVDNKPAEVPDCNVLGILHQCMHSPLYLRLTTLLSVYPLSLYSFAVPSQGSRTQATLDLANTV